MSGTVRRVLDHLVGAALLAVLVFALAAGIGTPPPGMSATIPGPSPYGLADAPDIRVDPVSLAPRLKREQWGGDAFKLTTWAVSYGNRWHRSITAAQLTKPLDEEGKAWCGLAARISPGVFDPKQAGDGMLDLVREEMNKVLPMSLPCGFSRNVLLKRPKKIELEMIPRKGAIDLSVVAHLPDGTKLGAASTIRLTSNAEGHLLVDHVGPVKPLFAGPGRAQCEGTIEVQLGQLWWRYIKGQKGSIVLAAAQAEMSRRIKPALDALNGSLAKLHEPMRPFAGRDVELRLRLARPPVVDDAGVALRLCANVALGGSRIDERITGPPLVRADPPPIPAPTTGARIDVNLNAEAVNRIIYSLWQMGELRRLGTATEILDQLPSDVRALAFEVTGFDPLLPPVLSPSGDVTAANIAVGTWGDRTVLGYATGSIQLEDQGGEGRVRMRASLDRLAVSCAEPAQTGWRLTPCLSELMPLISDQVRSNPPHFSLDTSALVAAIGGQTMHGLRLQLSPPRVELQKGMLKAQMSVKVGGSK